MCTRCSGKRKKVGAAKMNVSDGTITAVKTGAEVLVGFVGVEALTNQVGNFLPQANTPTGRIVVKVLGTAATVGIALMKDAKAYRSDLLTIAGGMAANAVATVGKNTLSRYESTAAIAAMIPSVSGISGGSTRISQRRISGSKKSPVQRFQAA